MKKLMILFSVAAFLCAACEALGPEIIEQAGQQPGGPKHLVKMIASPIPYADATKTTMAVNASGLQFNWSSGDKASVYSSTEDDFALFSLTGGEGSNSASFNCGTFTLTPGASYYAFYPNNGTIPSKTAIPLDFSSQSVTGDNDIVSPMTKDYMWAKATASGGTASFAFNHIGSFVRLQMSGLPEDGAVTNLQLIPLSTPLVETATFDITSRAINPVTTTPYRNITTTEVTVPAGGTSTVWSVMAPQDFSSDAFAIVATVGVSQYSARMAGLNQQAGKAYQWNVTPVTSTSAPAHGFTVTAKDQVEMVVPLYSSSETSMKSGNYSGITYLDKVSGKYTFAVVDDKLEGGIVFLSIPITDAGVVDGTNIERIVPSPSPTTSTDNEDIVKVGNYLWVAAEGDQSIRKYSATDAANQDEAFMIPADIGISAITSNAGFEALAYAPAKGKFWTTTELPLQKDTFLPRLHRLQRFDANGQPDARYFYQMDEPSKSAAEAAAAKSYVFGIPAMVALDDGRLLVMEREVYVPNVAVTLDITDEQISTIKSETFSKVKIFVVSPDTDPAGILRKSLLYQFQTGVEDVDMEHFSYSASLANYEGMCLGPALDGKNSLILIADSQGGSPTTVTVLGHPMTMKLTKEWIKVILFK